MIAIVDYGVGNLFSVEKAFLKFSPDVVLTSEAKIGRASCRERV